MHGCIIDDCISCVVFKWSFKMQIGWTMVIWATTGKPNGEKKHFIPRMVTFGTKKTQHYRTLSDEMPSRLWYASLYCKLKYKDPRVDWGVGGENTDNPFYEIIIADTPWYNLRPSVIICDEETKEKHLTPRNSCFGNNMKWTGGRCQIKWVIRKTSVLLDLGPVNPKQRLEHKEPRNCRLDFIREETTPASASLTAP